VDDDFVQQAARDAETEDALPLLAFALRELYDRAVGDNRLSLDDYLALGDQAAGLTPLENAVRRAADGVLAEARPAPAELLALREAFVPAMVRVNDQGDYVRRPARWDELPAKAHPLLERLAQARLLIVGQQGEARSVEVAHEALLRKWPTLRTWLDEAREFLVGSQQLERDLNDWQQAADADKPGALLTGLKLNRARGWLAERPQQLSAPARAYVQASIQQAEAEEARKLRQRRNITRASVAASVVLAVAAVFAGVNWLNARSAEASARQAAADAVEAEGKAKASEQRATAALDDLSKASQARVLELIRFAWTDLGAKLTEVARLEAQAKQHGLRPDALVPKVWEVPQPDGFDCKTWLDQGFRHLYCSVRSIISFDRLQSMAGLNVFLPGGPHKGEPNLSSQYTFGHYNPEFLAWLDRYVVPEGRDDKRFNAVTRAVYKAHVGPVVRALYNSHQILFAEPPAYDAFLKRYQVVSQAYLDKLARRETNEGRFGLGIERVQPITFDEAKRKYVQNIESRGAELGRKLQDDFSWLSDYLATDKDDDIYLANTAAGFWVRRSIDGTEAQFFALVKKMLQAFEPEVLARP
jgi:hypothetical protein